MSAQIVTIRSEIDELAVKQILTIVDNTRRLFHSLLEYISCAELIHESLVGLALP